MRGFFPKDPVSGPLTRLQLSALAEAPFGAAAEAIRQHDPLWGIAPGTKLKWRAHFSRSAREEGYALIEATSAEEAEKIACRLPDKDIHDCGPAYGGDWEFDHLEPATAKLAVAASPLLGTLADANSNPTVKELPHG